MLERWCCCWQSVLDRRSSPVQSSPGQQALSCGPGLPSVRTHTHTHSPDNQLRVLFMVSSVTPRPQLYRSPPPHHSLPLHFSPQHKSVISPSIPPLFPLSLYMATPLSSPPLLPLFFTFTINQLLLSIVLLLPSLPIAPLFLFNINRLLLPPPSVSLFPSISLSSRSLPLIRYFHLHRGETLHPKWLVVY